MSGNVTLVSTDPREEIERVLQVPEKEEETFGGAAEESAETVSESQTEQAESTEEAQRPSKRSQKVKRLAEKLTDSERRVAELEAKLASQSGRVEQPAKTEPEEEFNYPVPKPKLEDFQQPGDFVEALSDWKADAREYKKARQAEADQVQSIMTEHYERVDDARDRYKDFDEVVEGGEVPYRDEAARNAFKAAIFENEDGPDVLYYLGQHPEVAQEFAELRPVQVAAKVGRIAASLGQKSSPEPVKAAPRLINPVGSGSKRPDVANDRSNMSHAEWKRLRKAGQIR